MIKQIDRDLAAVLVKKGLLTQDTANQYLAEVQSSNVSLKTLLIKKRYLSESEVLSALALVLNLEYVDLKSLGIDREVLKKVPVRLAWYFKIMPISVEGKTLTLASSNQLDVKVQDEIRVHLGLEAKGVLATEKDILEALNKYYGLAADTVARLVKDGKDSDRVIEETWIEDLEKDVEDASITKLVNQILLEAYKKRATDIHIEPYREKVRIRYRIDGVLMDANIPPTVKEFLPSIISRIKIMANLSIVEKRLPQDGSAVVKTKEQDLDMRISTLPTPRGESMVIRVLPTNVRLMSLERLGLDEKNLKVFRSLVTKSNGIILVTGPTGSGKTTTLYACLNEINSPVKKIITLEDPIECEMEGITQIHVNHKVNLDFAKGLRSVLRHDPDIIMVGEIRDLETAEIAIRTALTGHVVFSTLHTNDAASGVTRLIEMGLEAYLVASSVEAFIAQRLVRIICPRCKEEVTTLESEVREEMAKSLKIKMSEVKIYQGKGCDHCNRTGFYGRTAIYEILLFDERIRSAILEKKRADQIKIIAMKNGMMTLRQDGWKKVLAGVTVPAEVINVTLKDEEIDVKEKSESISTSQVQNQGAIKASQAGLGSKRMFMVRTIPPQILMTENEYDSRTYIRAPEKIGIRYSVVRQNIAEPTQFSIDDVEHSSITKDISAGGLRFISGYTLRLGAIISLHIQLNKDERSIDCLAKVCRVEDDTLSAMYNLAVYYLDISSGDRARIQSYINDKLSQQKHKK